MFNEKLAGTYWLCANDDGSVFSLQATLKPVKSGGAWRSVSDMDNPVLMPWLNVRNKNGESASGYVYKNRTPIYASEFSDVNFPDVTFDDSPLEIEITKSGKVYWYD